MKRSEWRVSHLGPRAVDYDPEKNWFVSLWEVSPFRDAVDTVGDHVCALTHHRWCWMYSKVANWAFEKQDRILDLPITREQATLLSPEFVQWMDETWAGD